MNNKQRQTLSEIFEDPVRADLRWPDVRSLVGAAGGAVTEGSGSRVRLRLGTARMVIHTPHPGQILGRTTGRRLHEFFRATNLAPQG